MDFIVIIEGGDCIFIIELEELIIIDNCDGGMEYDVIVFFGVVGLGLYFYVFVGVYIV